MLQCAKPPGFKRGASARPLKFCLLCRGTFTTQTPKTAMKARQQGEADDRRAVSAIALEVFSGRSLHAALGEQYEQLSDGCKAELEAICQELYPHMARKKGLPRCLLMAAAEHYGKIRIQQVRQNTACS